MRGVITEMEIKKFGNPAGKTIMFHHKSKPWNTVLIKKL